MWVFGERISTIEPCAALRRIARDWAAAHELPPGIARHAALISAFVAMGELAQGLADAAFERRGLDEDDPLNDAALALLRAMAAAVEASRRPDREPSGSLPSVSSADWPPFRNLEAQLPAMPVRVKRAEGFAHYALYPEAYAAAAATLPGDRPLVVIGLRSIGLPLAAMVAAATCAADAVSVRPVGHPFDRRLAVGPRLRDRLMSHRGARFVVVDEGPGLSGSSFGAALAWLEGQGVPARDIHLMPSHSGTPGPEASPDLAARWPQLSRHVASGDDSFGALGALKEWFGDLGLSGPLRDVAGGLWREELIRDPTAWPAVDPRLERRKWLANGPDGPLLLKFSGIGRQAALQLDRAQALAEAGLAPQVLALRHGMLAMRWHADARPGVLPPGQAPGHIGRYLGWRARRWPAGDTEGASLADLLAMARRNTELALGPELAGRLDAMARHVPALEGNLRRVATDNRLEPWEWIGLPGGAVLKTDGLDHTDGHDLIGAQDPAWDIASAIDAFGFDAAGTEALCDAFDREAGRRVDRRLVAWLTPCRRAFAHGRDQLALDANRGTPEEPRLAAAAARSRVRLRRALSKG